MPRIFPNRGQRSNEEVFFEHYPQLLKWALQLSRLDRDDAEDLVQDFYLQTAHINVVLSEIAELEPYLFKILRNLHYSRLRRQGKNTQHGLSIVDFDSVEQGLAAVDRNDLLLIHANLKVICEFACQRKRKSRAASIFILRFFLGYYSSEVMRIAHMTRMGVDRALQVARSEARRYLDKPNAERPQTHQDRQRVRAGKDSSDSHTLFIELRQTIFKSCEGPCFEHSALKQHYEADSSTRFSVRELAHLVSCKICLDRVNAILGLLPLDERSPDDTIGRDNPPGSGAGEGSGFTLTRGKKLDASSRRRKALERKKRELFEHRPESLELAIDGETRTTHRVTAEVSELKLTLNRADEPGFIEVFSEQGIRLAYLHVVEPTSSPDLQLREHVALSDGRFLELTLSFANDLSTVHVVYRDPVFAQTVSAEDESDAGLFLVSEERNDASDAGVPNDSGQQMIFPLRRWLLVKRQELARPRMNPLFASALILAFASLLCFFFWWRSGITMTANAFLDRAQAKDVSTEASAQPGVIFQKIRIKTPTRTAERTLYRDAQHRRRVRERALDPTDTRLKTKLTEAGVDWNDPLSAVGYHDWHNREVVQSDSVMRVGADRLILTTRVSDGDVLSETLTVRESDFHTVGRTIELRDYGTVEIAELNYDVLPWGAVNQEWFEPLAGAAVSDVPAMHAVIHLPHILSDLELDEAELAARTALNQLHADTGEPIHISRAASGIDIKGVVDTDSRKHELLSRLALLPNVHASILSAEEIGTRPPLRSADFGTDLPIHVYSVEAQPSPLEQYLRANNLQTDQLASFSHNLLDKGLEVSQAEVHLADLRPRFTEADQLSPDSQNQLSSLSRTYIGKIEAGLDANERALLSLGFDSADKSTAIPDSGDPDGDLDEQVRRYRQLCLELISNGTGQSRPAATITAELASTSARIRQHLVRLSATIPRGHN